MACGDPGVGDATKMRALRASFIPAAHFNKTKASLARCANGMGLPAAIPGWEMQQK